MRLIHFFTDKTATASFVFNDNEALRFGEVETVGIHPKLLMFFLPKMRDAALREAAIKFIAWIRFPVSSKQENRIVCKLIS